MSEPDENRPPYPRFQHPEGATPFSDEPTLPFVDLYPQSDSSGSPSAHGANASQQNPGPYGGGLYGGAQYPPQQYGNAPYQVNSPYDPNPHLYPMATAPQQQQSYGYYAYAPVEHPSSTAVLVLALVGFVQPITPFIAWYLGGKAKAEINRGAPFPYTGSLKIGHIIGKVLSILTIAGISAYVLLVILVVVAAMAF